VRVEIQLERIEAGGFQLCATKDGLPGCRYLRVAPTSFAKTGGSCSKTLLKACPYCPMPLWCTPRPHYPPEADLGLPTAVEEPAGPGLFEFDLRMLRWLPVDVGRTGGLQPPDGSLASAGGHLYCIRSNSGKGSDYAQNVTVSEIIS
jgi:hypothetical protein